MRNFYNVLDDCVMCKKAPYIALMLHIFLTNLVFSLEEHSGPENLNWAQMIT